MRNMSARYTHKNTKHKNAYSTLALPLNFLPLVVSTFGTLHLDFLRLLWLTTSAASGSGLAIGEVREHHNSDVRRMLFSKLSSRVSVAAARSCAMRYTGFSGFRLYSGPIRNHVPSDANFTQDNRIVGSVIGPTCVSLRGKGGGSAAA